MQDLLDYGNGIHAFDSGYVRPDLAAIHLIVERGRVALVDTGNNDSLLNTLKALSRLGLGPDAVEYVILTHIHLDHAGGAGAMMAAFPRARLVVHPRGRRHMADPAQLLAGVRAVYGEEATARLYGELLPVPDERMIEAVDGLELDLAGRKLLCLDAPGHARHHIAIVDERAKGIFTGDLFGLSYREMDVADRQFIFPTTTPVQFDPVAMHASIDRLLTYAPEAVYLTHFGRVHAVLQQAAQLHRLLDRFLEIARAADAQGAARHEQIKQGLTDLLRDEAKNFGCLLDERTLLELWETDLELNAQGLGIWLDQQAAHK
ncbi:MAG: MBL fold metallo-hydrolase [Azovibrio sp.]|uniref:MBL fold metallo-hydrolase n=1 Tax=Azovibrio sp. TaxID=1872673 RepID=UPI003C756E99